MGYDGDQQVKYYVRIYFIIIIFYISTHHDNNIPIHTTDQKSQAKPQQTGKPGKPANQQTAKWQTS